jgi:hypothetical protein
MAEGDLQAILIGFRLSPLVVIYDNISAFELKGHFDKVSLIGRDYRALRAVIRTRMKL